MTSLRDMSVWSIAIGVELGLGDALQGRRIRFYCLDCIGALDPRGEWPVQRAPYASECMHCIAPREPIVSAIEPGSCP